jgi:sensor histidine kinase YesM
VVLPFLPRLFNYYNLIWPMWKNLFTSNFIKNLRMNAGNLKHRSMSDEESDQIDEYEKNIEDIEKKLKDHDDKKK